MMPLNFLLRPLSALLCCAGILRAADPPAPPEVLAAGWTVSLFAAEPDIVTPVGIAVDAKGRVFTVENHTHEVKPGYAGPATDRVRIYEDTDGDGRADKISLFAEGFTSAMNLAFSPGGVLHLTHRNGVLRLEDADGDGVCERQVPLLTLDTTVTYPHNGISGIAFSPDGFLYIGSGENFGTVYTARGADGTAIRHTPGGANIFRMKPDGSALEIFATGLWNAFVLTTDGAGRVIVCDNDPDSRPPCRLLHIVRGGDYGYQFQYGRSGLHPLVCWNGELPGTLPMAAGTGEAPTGILDARHAALGPDRGDGFLVTEWGDSTLSWYRLQARGASFTATRETVLRGGPGFRPACLAAAPDGRVFLTDWADREYAVHGKGRIWQIRAAWPDKTPRAGSILPATPEEQRATRLAETGDPAAWPQLKAALTDPDPFIVSAALTALAPPSWRNRLLEAARDPDPAIRHGALLALRRSGGDPPVELIRGALQSPDAPLRRLGLRWAAELRRAELRPDVENSLEGGGRVNQEEFALWLAALDLISRKAPPTAATVSDSNDALLQKLLADSATAPAVKAAVLPMLTNFKAPPAIRTLIALTSADHPQVRLEAVRSLAFVGIKAAAPPLRKIALSPQEPASLRLEAAAALSGRDTAEVLPLLPLLQDPGPDLVRETLRVLRPHAADPAVAPALAALAARPDLPESVKEAVALATGQPPPAPRPADDAAWTSALLAPRPSARADRGRLVFFSASAACATCHRVQGRGASAGPDLSTIARSSSREKLIQSLLQPSREIGPLYRVKTAVLKNGTLLSGIPAAKDGGGNLDLQQPAGVMVHAPRDEIVRLEDSPVSLMPEGLETGLTLQDLHDLLAWLETLK